MSVNKVILLGRLGQDPELKYTPGGMAVCTLRLATNEYWVDKSGQKQEKTEWHSVVVWGKQAEHCNQYLAKGRQVFVEGRLQTRSWDAKDGTKRYATEVNASTVQFIDGQKGASNGDAPRQNNYTNNQQPAQAPSEPEYNITTDASFTADDIPF